MSAASLTQALRRVYHQLIPDAVRYPIGHARRLLIDRWYRSTTPGPLPPRALLDRVQMTPWIREYLDVGLTCASTILRQLEQRGMDTDAEERVLDFGCGLARTLRWLPEAVAWQLNGCDVDTDQIRWCRRAFPTISFETNSPSPPLPFPDASFSALWSISVFTHFNADEQRRWAAEVARVLAPGAIALISTMGTRALGNFQQLATPERRQQLSEEGFVFHQGGEQFNARGAFHTRDGIEEVFTPYFEVKSWIEGGLDGFQDLTVLRRLQPAIDSTRPDA